jgi:hypothetical protein
MPAKTTGEKLTTALQGLEKLSTSRKTVWGTPVPWTARPVFTQGFQVAPDFGSANQVIICAYQIPRGMSALICGLVLGYQGGGGSALPGQVLYNIDVDNPFAAPTPGVGYTEKDYALQPFQVGSFVPGDPWPVEFKHDENETVRIKAQTVSGVATGPGNTVFGALIGFQWPSMGWER